MDIIVKRGRLERFYFAANLIKAAIKIIIFGIVKLRFEDSNAKVGVQESTHSDTQRPS